MGTESFAGPPHNCRLCGGDIKKGATATSGGSGCLVLLVGLVLSPVLIGIPIVLYGVHLMGQRDSFWQCRLCGEKFPRLASWYELSF